MSYSSLARCPARLAYQVWEWTRSQPADAGGHRQVGGEDAQRRVGAGEPRVVLGVGGGARPRRAQAVHVDVDEPAQLADEEVDVHAGAAVDVGRVLPGEDADPHGEGL